MNKYVRPAVIAPSLKTVGHKIANDPTGLLGLDEARFRRECVVGRAAGEGRPTTHMGGSLR